LRNATANGQAFRCRPPAVAFDIERPGFERTCQIVSTVDRGKTAFSGLET
jgi:hypothetical protein